MLITTSNSLRRWHRLRGWILDKDNLRTAMDKRALSQEQLGALIRAERGMVSHWLSGKHQPTMNNYLRLCDVLKVQP